jgi:L-malate glycosyltransferase
MTTSREYTIVVPRIVDAGPINVATELANAAAAKGWRVRMLGLSGGVERTDLDPLVEARRISMRDLFVVRGVVHTHGLRPDLIGWFFSLREGCQVATTLHNHFMSDLSFGHRPWVVSLAFRVWSLCIRRFQVRICISKTMCRYYERLMPDASFQLAYNFRAPQADTAADARQLQWIADQRRRGQTVLIYVGALVARKNVEALVDAVAAEPGFSLALCGQGDLESQIRRRIGALAAHDRIAAFGQVRNPRLLLRECHLLALPSHAEGMPMAVLEAASVGRPCLMSNIAVHREMASLGLGAVFDRHRFSDFAAVVRQLTTSHTQPPDADPNILGAFASRFSVHRGFDRYQALFFSGGPEKS